MERYQGARRLLSIRVLLLFPARHSYLRNTIGHGFISSVGFSLLIFGPYKDELPQAEACAT